MLRGKDTCATLPNHRPYALASLPCRFPRQLISFSIPTQHTPHLRALLAPSLAEKHPSDRRYGIDRRSAVIDHSQSYPRMQTRSARCSITCVSMREVECLHPAHAHHRYAAVNRSSFEQYACSSRALPVHSRPWQRSAFASSQPRISLSSRLSGAQRGPPAKAQVQKRAAAGLKVDEGSRFACPPCSDRKQQCYVNPQAQGRLRHHLAETGSGGKAQKEKMRRETRAD